MVSCDFSNAGCNGGYLTPSLNYLITDGIVSESCLPYTNKTGFCLYRCSTGPTVPYWKYYCKANSTKLLTDHGEMQQEILNNGPMMVAFTLYDDFFSYYTGIYQHLTGGVAGGHAVKVIGWDYDQNGVLYWIC